jgi:DNA processing protein
MNIMNDPELLYKIALSLIPGIGSITARKLINSTGNPRSVFYEKRSMLLKIPGVGQLVAEKISAKGLLKKAEEEIAYISRNDIKPLYFKDKDYPERLNQCPDGPIMIYVKGNVNFNGIRFLSIVGTRTPTSYGIEMTRKIVASLHEKGHQLVIVSGLAYGIDVCAHKAALSNGFKTVAVLGHGLKYLYPSVHFSVAGKIVKQGALLTDFPGDEKPERNNFIKRNRIIAGLSDATIIVESNIKGGALITADIANSYNRDVFAVPGRAGDPFSSGTNQLIKRHHASLIENCEDIEYLLGWDIKEKSMAVQAELFRELSEEEQILLNILSREEKLEIDLLCIRTGIPVNKVSALLLNLEFAGYVKSLPGNLYKIRRI